MDNLIKDEKNASGIVEVLPVNALDSAESPVRVAVSSLRRDLYGVKKNRVSIDVSNELVNVFKHDLNIGNKRQQHQTSTHNIPGPGICSQEYGEEVESFETMGGDVADMTVTLGVRRASEVIPVKYFADCIDAKYARLRQIYWTELNITRVWLMREMKKIRVLEKFLFGPNFSDALKPLIGLILTKAFGDLALELSKMNISKSEMTMEDAQHKDKTYVYHPCLITWKDVALKLDLLHQNQWPDTVQACKWMTAVLSVVAASTALNLSKQLVDIDTTSDTKSESEFVVRCLCALDKPKSMELCREIDNERSFNCPQEYISTSRMNFSSIVHYEFNEPAKLMSMVEDLDALDSPQLPTFEEFYGVERLQVLCQAWDANQVLHKFEMTPMLYQELCSSEYKPSHVLLQSLSEYFEAIKLGITNELYTCHAHRFILKELSENHINKSWIYSNLCDKYVTAEAGQMYCLNQDFWGRIVDNVKLEGILLGDHNQQMIMRSDPQPHE